MNQNFILYVAILLLAIVFTRLVFSIPTILKHLSAQTKLLSFIAQKNGTDPEVIARILDNTLSKEEANNIKSKLRDIKYGG